MTHVVSKTVVNLEVERERERLRVREVARVLALLLILLVPFLIYIAEGIEVVRSGYRIEQLKSTRAALEDEGQKLAIEKAGLLSTGRIEQIATGRLGLAYPAPGQATYVPGGAPGGAPPAGQATPAPQDEAEDADAEGAAP